ncbi:hypothetical protein EDB86DRAFT_2827646 [Lactarius hatsudake]|nr:hypothetical protein EDB86DRAFT_2827646 [Lactarius hatsudake]
MGSQVGEERKGERKEGDEDVDVACKLKLSCGLNVISDAYFFKRKQAFLISSQEQKRGIGSVGGCKDVIYELRPVSTGGTRWSSPQQCSARTVGSDSGNAVAIAAITTAYAPNQITIRGKNLALCSKIRLISRWLTHNAALPLFDPPLKDLNNFGGIIFASQTGKRGKDASAGVDCEGQHRVVANVLSKRGRHCASHTTNHDQGDDRRRSDRLFCIWIWGSMKERNGTDTIERYNSGESTSIKHGGVHDRVADDQMIWPEAIMASINNGSIKDTAKTWIICSHISEADL